MNENLLRAVIKQGIGSDFIATWVLTESMSVELENLAY